MVQFDEEKQNRRVAELKKEEAENLTRVMAARHNLPYLDLSIFPINIDALRIMKEENARAIKIAPFNIIDKKVQIGVLSPKSQDVVDAIDDLRHRGYEPSLFMVSEESLNKVWERYKDLSYSFETKGGSLTISSEEVVEFLKQVRSMADIEKLIREALSEKKIYRISKLLEIMLAGALSVGASDIHLEPEEDYVLLRYRLDGLLTDVLKFDNDTYSLVLSRIKLISNLKLNIKGKAQDGRFSIKVRDTEIEIRTSLLPGAYNDTIVLRILNPNAISVPFEELGIHPRLLSLLEKEIRKPNGMILNTGPTGSGKTTTLYAFLKKIHSPGIKIITIENPIEYHLPGIVQTQTDDEKGYTFLEGLRSALRQDPDVIMVGEIRDSETAEIAINAALTGHLVFSTLHTNNAAGTFPRLIDLGVNYKVITSAISIAMAQRLVRKLCPDCRTKKSPSDQEKGVVNRVLATFTDKTYLDGVQTESIWEAHGCDKCRKTGYIGRIGIFEAIKSDENIEKVIEMNPSEREVKEAAKSQNILSMTQDGILKVLAGTTSLDELGRVIDIS